MVLSKPIPNYCLIQLCFIMNKKKSRQNKLHALAKDQEMQDLLISWCSDVNKIHKWVFSAKEMSAGSAAINDIYKKVQTMWFDYRDIFPNKGTYKLIRRMFIRKAAMFFMYHPRLWCTMSAELCKEILHKEDQRWLSFDYKDRHFVDFLLYKASKAGYSKRRHQEICYVDANLNIVSNPQEAVGIANLLSSIAKVEILFFEPLSATNITREEALRLLEKKDKTICPSGVWNFPTAATCKIANIFCANQQPIISNCHVSYDASDVEYSGERVKAILDDDAVLDFAGSKKRVENVFVSLYLPTECFVRQSFPCHYITNWHTYRW